MRDPQDIVIQPVITEKATRQMDEENVYTFLVRDGVNKIEIGRAVEKLWDVRVVGESRGGTTITIESTATNCHPYN